MQYYGCGEAEEGRDGDADGVDDEVGEPVAGAVEQGRAYPPRGDDVSEEDDSTSEESADCTDFYAASHESRF